MKEEKDITKKEAKPEKRMSAEEKAQAKEKVEKIIKKAKEKGKLTYGELALELDDANQDQIEKVFDVMEELGVDVLKDDFDDEPNEEDLKEVENLKLDEVTQDDTFEGINVDDPVRIDRKSVV